MTTGSLGLFTLACLLPFAFTACNRAHQTETVIVDTTHAPAADMGAFAANTSGRERSIDMGQFARTVLDLKYTRTGNARQTLDIVYPEKGTAPYKTIVLLHGGGWMAGDKQSEELASVFAAVQQGYAVVSVNYRLSDKVTWPMPLYDAKAAIRFIRANAGRYELDADRLVVWGLSAGGHIGGMLAATNGDPAFEDLAMGSPDASSAVQGVVSWYGVSDMSSLTDSSTRMANAVMGFDVQAEKERTREANPVQLATDRFPPILLVHGTADELVPYRQSVTLQQVVNEKTGKETAVLKLIDGGSHGDARITAPEQVADNLNFADRILYQGSNPHRNTVYREVRMRNAR